MQLNFSGFALIFPVLSPAEDWTRVFQELSFFFFYQSDGGLSIYKKILVLKVTVNAQVPGTGYLL